MGYRLTDGIGFSGAMEANPIIAIGPKADPARSHGVTGMAPGNRFTRHRVNPGGILAHIRDFEFPGGGFPAAPTDRHGIAFDDGCSLI